MNQFFYESRGKEKVKDLMEEGLQSQAVHQTRVKRSARLHILPKLALTILGILGILEILLYW